MNNRTMIETKQKSKGVITDDSKMRTINVLDSKSRYPKCRQKMEVNLWTSENHE